jgi:hypothetical protein
MRNFPSVPHLDVAFLFPLGKVPEGVDVGGLLDPLQHLHTKEHMKISQVHIPLITEKCENCGGGINSLVGCLYKISKTALQRLSNYYGLKVNREIFLDFLCVGEC